MALSKLNKFKGCTIVLSFHPAPPVRVGSEVSAFLSGKQSNTTELTQSQRKLRLRGVPVSFCVRYIFFYLFRCVKAMTLTLSHFEATRTTVSAVMIEKNLMPLSSVELLAPRTNTGVTAVVAM